MSNSFVGCLSVLTRVLVTVSIALGGSKSQLPLYLLLIVIVAPILLMTVKHCHLASVTWKFCYFFSNGTACQTLSCPWRTVTNSSVTLLLPLPAHISLLGELDCPPALSANIESWGVPHIDIIRQL